MVDSGWLWSVAKDVVGGGEKEDNQSPEFPSQLFGGQTERGRSKREKEWVAGECPSSCWRKMDPRKGKG